MRRFSLLAALLLPLGASAGPVADQFAGGWGGISFGTPLANLIGVLPDGEQYFSTAPGGRVYTIHNDESILGVPRSRMRIQYHLDAAGTVGAIGIGVPYERRDQLLGVMLGLFGAYRSSTVGISTDYSWPSDRGIFLYVRSSTNPVNGILELWILNASTVRETLLQRRCPATKDPAAAAPKT